MNLFYIIVIENKQYVIMMLRMVFSASRWVENNTNVQSFRWVFRAKNDLRTPRASLNDNKPELYELSLT